MSTSSNKSGEQHRYVLANDVTEPGLTIPGEAACLDIPGLEYTVTATNEVGDGAESEAFTVPIPEGEMAAPQ